MGVVQRPPRKSGFETSEGSQELAPRSQLGPEELLRELGSTLRLSEAQAAELGSEDPSEDQTMIINMGPQHPSTHGVLRLMLELDGETVLRTKPVIGYLHTGMEKTGEELTYLQGPTNVTRMDYASPLFSELAFSLTTETLLGIDEDVPPRAQWIRMLLTELNRISSHLLFMATNGMSVEGGLTTPDLYALFGPESTGFDTWTDAAKLAAEVGGSGNFPDRSLEITAPGEESGTYDAFIELAGIADLAEQRGLPEAEVETLRADYQSSPDDNVIIQAMEGSPSALGFVGYAFAQSAGDQVRELAIDGGDGCVSPDQTSIADGSYPLSRSLFIYVNNAKAEEKGTLSAYVDQYLGDLYDCVTEAGYVALEDDALGEAVSTWEATGLNGGEDDGSRLVISGSSTVEPISQCVLEQSGYQGGVEGPGTGDGFQRFCNGETDISDASRAIKDEEASTCEENGVEYTELQIGIDGMAVMTATS
jgi:ABC-type phosphate transport system substrate-binding protein